MARGVTRTVEASPAVVAFARAPRSRYVVGLQVPEATFVATLRTSLVRTAAVGGLVLVLGAAAATLIARFIVTAFRRVPEVAETRLAAGAPAGRWGRLREADALSAAGEWVGDVRQRRRDGAWITVHLRRVLRRDAAGVPVALLENAADVTMLRAVEAELRLLNQDLGRQVEQEVAAREMAQARVAHDFNNLLMALSGNLEMLQPEPCDMEALLAGLVGLLQAALGPEVRIELKPGSGGAVCRIDPAEFERAALNIALDARDAMDRRGTLGIRTRRLGDQLEIGFADTGRGTTVTLLLPLAAQPAAPVAEHEPAARGDHPLRMTVLVVDDTPDVLETVVATLEAAGCTVLQANDAAEALALVREHCDRIDLVLTDIMMPGGMPGTELARRIPDVCPGTPTVLMSGYADHQNDNDVLRKPFSTRDLLRAIRAAAPAARRA